MTGSTNVMHIWGSEQPVPECKQMLTLLQCIIFLQMHFVLRAFAPGEDNGK